MVDVAEVKIWGELVGAVRWDDEQQLASFQYDKKFIEKKQDLSPIKIVYIDFLNYDRIKTMPLIHSRDCRDYYLMHFLINMVTN